MSKFCINCGKPITKDAKYCLNCGQSIIADLSQKTDSEKEALLQSKKEVKYVLSSSQRDIFLKKILPTMAIGSMIWLFSEIIFSMIFIEIEFEGLFIAFYFSMVILECLLFIFLFFSSRADNVQLGLILFFSICFIAGILSLPIIMITDFLPQVHMFVSLSFGSILIVCFIGVILKGNYFAKGYLWTHIILFIIGTIILEIIFIVIFQIHNYLLTIPVSLAYILIVALTTMFYGSKVVQKNEKDPWLYLFFKIEGILLLSLIIAVVVVAVVLIIIIIGVTLGGTDLNLSGFGGWGKKSKKKGVRKKE
ncbi:MAG: zinc-ribbon domain-containing protein [Promethearchaeota archaeon]